MAITISGENNNDKILATDGVIDQISGFSVVGVMTATSFTGDLTGNVTGNLTGNVNSTSPLLLQTGGYERFRITGNNELGIAGANYGSSGQVLTSGGSGSAVTWSAIPSQVTIANNADNRVITGGSGTNLNGESSLTYDGTMLFCTGGTITAERGAIPSVESKNSTSSSYARFYCSQTSGSGGYAAFQKLGTTSTAIGGANATQIWCTGDAPLVIGVNNGERLRITSGGNVQVNGGALHLDANGELAVFETDTNLAFTNSAKLAFDYSGNVARIRSSHNGSGTTRPLAFYIANDEILRINTNGKVSLGSAPPTSPVAWLHVKGNTYQTLRLENYDGGGNGPYIELYNNSASPADDDYTGIISFKNRNSANEEITYSQIRSQSTDITDASEDGIMTFHTRKDGTFGERLRITSGGCLALGTNSPGQSTLPGIHIKSTANDDCRIAFETGNKPSSRIGYYGLSNRFGVDVYNGFEIRDVGASYASRFLIGSDGQATFDVGAPSSSNKVIGRFQSQSTRALDIVWHDSGSLMGFNTPGNHSYIFKCNDSEKLRITSTGEVKQYGFTGSADTAVDDLVIGNTDSGTNRGMTIWSHSNQNGGIAFADNDSNFRGAIQYLHAQDRLRFIAEGEEVGMWSNQRGLMVGPTSTGDSVTSKGGAKLYHLCGATPLNGSYNSSTETPLMRCGHSFNGIFQMWMLFNGDEYHKGCRQETIMCQGTYGYVSNSVRREHNQNALGAGLNSMDFGYQNSGSPNYYFKVTATWASGQNQPYILWSWTGHNSEYPYAL